MKYTFKIADVNLTRLFRPDISNVTFNKVKNRDDQFGRLEMSGTFKLYGEDAKLIFDFIDDFGHNEVGITVYQNATYIGFGLFNTKQIENRDLNQYTFKGVVQDEYSRLFEYGDIKYNILESYVDLDIDYIRDEDVETVTKNIFNSPFLTTCGGSTGIPSNGSEFYNEFDTFDPWTNWTLLSATYTVDSYLQPYAYISGEGVFISQLRPGFYTGSTPNSPSGTGWVYVYDKELAGVNYPYYRRPITGTDVFVTSGSWSGSCTIVGPEVVTVTALQSDNTKTLPETKIDYSGVTRRIDKSIEFILDKIDSSINIDSSGTTTDSFYSFKTITGKSIPSNVSFYDDKPFVNFIMVQLTDFIPDPDTGLQKSNKASKGMLSFNDFMEWLKTYGFYWFLEVRDDGLTYYRLLHKEHIILLDENPNLQNWKGYNYLTDYKNFEYEAPEYSRLVNKQKANNVEHIGVDVTFPTLPDKKNRDISSSIFFADLEHVYSFGESEYDTSSIESFVLACATIPPFSSHYEIRRSDGILLEDTEVINGELSWAYVSQNYICELPDEIANINNIPIILDSYRLAKLKKFELNIPINGIEDFDLTSYLNIESEQAEIQSFGHPALNNIGKLNLRL